MGGGFCAGGAGRARWAGLGFAHGAVPHLLPGARAVRECAALSRLERDQLGELDGADPSSVREGTSVPRHVSTEKIFYERQRKRGGEIEMAEKGDVLSSPCNFEAWWLQNKEWAREREE